MSRIKECSLSVGARGEDIAVAYLRENGYKILARNARPDGHEELDIVCETRNVRVFAEVKTRTQDPAENPRYGTPATAVTHEKRRHLINVARAYNTLYPTKKEIRMDVIEVYLRGEAQTPYVHHMEDAFRS